MRTAATITTTALKLTTPGSREPWNGFEGMSLALLRLFSDNEEIGADVLRGPV